MRPTPTLLAMSAALALWGAPALAQTPRTPAAPPPPAATQPDGANPLDALFTDAMVETLIATARKNLSRSPCAPDRLCSPETPEELLRPIVSVPNARRALITGVRSAFAKACGLDWKVALYDPMMDQVRALKPPEKAAATIGLLHGLGMAIGGKRFETRPCTPEEKRSVEALMRQGASGLTPPPSSTGALRGRQPPG